MKDKVVVVNEKPTTRSTNESAWNKNSSETGLFTRSRSTKGETTVYEIHGFVLYMFALVSWRQMHCAELVKFTKKDI